MRVELAPLPHRPPLATSDTLQVPSNLAGSARAEPDRMTPVLSASATTDVLSMEGPCCRKAPASATPIPDKDGQGPEPSQKSAAFRKDFAMSSATEVSDLDRGRSVRLLRA